MNGQPRTYVVHIEEQDDGPDAALRERFATCAAHQLGLLEEREGTFPEAGGSFSITDAFEGKYVWEMTDDEVASSPLTIINLDVLSVDPTPASSADTVHVTVRVAG